MTEFNKKDTMSANKMSVNANNTNAMNPSENANVVESSKSVENSEVSQSVEVTGLEDVENEGVHLEFTVNDHLFYLEYSENENWWCIYDEEYEFHGTSLVDVDVDELSAWLAEKAGQEGCETQFEFTVGDETFLYDRCSDGSWSVQMYTDNEEYPIYTSDVPGDLYGLIHGVMDMIEENKYKEEEYDVTFIPKDNSVLANEIRMKANMMHMGLMALTFWMGRDKYGNVILCDLTRLYNGSIAITIYDPWRMHNTDNSDCEWRSRYDENDVEVYADVAMDFIYRLINTEK